MFKNLRAVDLNTCFRDRESLMSELQLGNWYSLGDGGDFHLKISVSSAEVPTDSDYLSLSRYLSFLVFT